MKKYLKAFLGTVVVAFAGLPAAAATLDDVREAGMVRCGVNTGLPGFSIQNENGEWSGFDVDFCRAVAAAIFDGDPSKVEYMPLSASQRFRALQENEINILARNTSWTMNRDTALGLTFTGINYYDGQAFMARKELEVMSALQLSGARVCVQNATTTQSNLTDYFRMNNMEFQPIVIDDLQEVIAAYEQGRCDVLTADASALYANRLELSNPDEHVVLPEIISKEPLGLLVRQGDEQWFDIVKWVVFGLINAEELGITQNNVKEMENSENPNVRRLLGKDVNLGEDLGLSNDWMVRVISAVGNYGEIFDRNIGPDTELKIQRGLNALWTKGGLQYAPPVR